MKILWATPWNVDSAIARVSAMVVCSLKRLGIQVCVVRTEDVIQVLSKPLQAAPLARLPFQVDSMESFDATVVNFGDHWPFHAKAMEFLSATPCIAVLHDATMLNYFLSRAHFEGGQHAVQQFCDEGLRIYGPDPEASEAPTTDHYRWAKSASKHWPFMHPIAAHSSALVVHSDHCVNALPESCRNKTRVVMLPAFPTPMKRSPRPMLNEDQISFCTIGHMNENKRVASVMRAIAASGKLRDRSVYTLAGPITDEQREPLESLAAELGFQGLRILGRVTDTEMSECLNGSDVICCLRYPTLEGASASVLEVLQYGRPTLVTDAGFYRQLPDDCVWKIDPENEIANITRHLESIICNYPKALAKAGLGPAWVSANCSADHYAEQIAALCRDLLPSKAVSQARRQLEAKASTFSRVEPGALVNERIQRVSESLFGTQPISNIKHFTEDA